MKLSSIPLFSMHAPPPLWKFFENSSILGKQASLSCWTRFLLCWEPLRHVISTTEHSDFQEWNCDQEKSWLRRRKMLNFNSQIVFVFFCVTCLCFLCICVFVCLYLCSFVCLCSFVYLCFSVFLYLCSFVSLYLFFCICVAIMTTTQHRTEESRRGLRYVW